MSSKWSAEPRYELVGAIALVAIIAGFWLLMVTSRGSLNW